MYKPGLIKERQPPRNKGKPRQAAYGPVLNKASAAEYLCVSERTLERWVKQKKIRKVRGTTRALYPQSELDRFIANNL